jgi:hypothetical protein
MKRAFITAENYYNYHDIYDESACMGGYFDNAPRYGSFKINSPHPVFVVDTNGNYFIADEKGGRLHRYDIVFGEKVVELYEKEKDAKTKEALKILLQSNLTNQYFVYEQTGEIKDYQLKSWLNQLNAYENLNGNDYVHELDRRIKKMKIVKTDILK